MERSSIDHPRSHQHLQRRSLGRFFSSSSSFTGEPAPDILTSTTAAGNSPPTPAPQFYQLWGVSPGVPPPPPPVPYPPQPFPGIPGGPLPPVGSPLTHYAALMSSAAQASLAMYVNFVRSIYASCRLFLSELFWSNVQSLMPYFAPPWMTRLWRNGGPPLPPHPPPPPPPEQFPPGQFGYFQGIPPGGITQG